MPATAEHTVWISFSYIVFTWVTQSLYCWEMSSGRWKPWTIHEPELWNIKQDCRDQEVEQLYVQRNKGVFHTFSSVRLVQVGKRSSFLFSSFPRRHATKQTCKPMDHMSSSCSIASATRPAACQQTALTAPSSLVSPRVQENSLFRSWISCVIRDNKHGENRYNTSEASGNLTKGWLLCGGYIFNEELPEHMQQCRRLDSIPLFWLIFTFWCVKANPHTYAYAYCIRVLPWLRNDLA